MTLALFINVLIIIIIIIIITDNEKNSKISYINFDKMYESDRRTDGHRMTAKAALDASIARQKPTNCVGAPVKPCIVLLYRTT